MMARRYRRTKKDWSINTTFPVLSLRRNGMEGIQDTIRRILNETVKLVQISSSQAGTAGECTPTVCQLAVTMALIYVAE